MRLSNLSPKWGHKLKEGRTNCLQDMFTYMISAAMKAFAFLLVTLFFVKMNAEEAAVIHEEKGAGKVTLCGNDFTNAHTAICIDYFKSLGKRDVKASEGNSSNLSFLYIQLKSCTTYY